ncbi:alpha/beta fold hydrolase [Nocardia arthritidis]|uniref:Alpha/beta fold hydrolase n=1 Tax=Nocardia arthritidis TaxID=228602 RepID=A0A6G9YAK8_9NOCA|nr:alpha/beta hydrolase [Nocardia arthritidis]QIS10198.1 alpha/beta fold hydrolase [Nocardia arthritidis]
MAEEVVSNVGPAGITMAYERLGDPAGPPVLLIMGGGAQLIHWPDGFCAELVDCGLQVIRFDNRDAGRSTHFADGPQPDFQAALAGDFTTVRYTLSDMAADAIGLLDALGYESAHIVGASQGGMIAQSIAIEYPHRVRSLTSMMSTTGNPEVGRTDMHAFGSQGPAPEGRAEFIEWQVRLRRTLGSPGFAFDAAAVADRAGRAYDRDNDRGALIRQAAAVLASGDRTARLRELRVPTLVIHGTADLVIDISGGEATAAAVPDAELITFEGMGHSLPRELWPVFADHIAGLVERADARNLLSNRRFRRGAARRSGMSALGC